MSEGPSRAENDQVESILLAEYSALRTEIERRCNIQWSLFALQVTTAGAIASLAIARTSNLALLLLIPLSSFMFGFRYILHDVHIDLIAQYVRESLSGRLGNNLNWDTWKKSAIADNAYRAWFSPTGWKLTHPTRLAFEGLAILALIATAVGAAYHLLTRDYAWPVIAGLTAGWLLGVAVTWVLHRAFEKRS
jgi:hypothetical protein